MLRCSVIAAVSLSAIPGLTRRDTPHWAMAAGAPPIPHFNSVPCPRLAPDRLTTMWNVTWLNPTRRTSAGRRTTARQSAVRQLYREYVTRRCSSTTTPLQPLVPLPVARRHIT
jgi:hypothetical protein